MKSKNLMFTVLIAVFVFLAIPVSTFAQTIVGDTMYCPAATYGAKGALRKLIEGDTLASGARKNINRVYKVERGGIYWWDASSNQNYPLTIVADDDNPASPKAPPIFAPAILDDGTSAGSWINCRKGNLYLKNIYFQYWRPTDNKQVGWSSPVRAYADSVRITIKGCIFDGTCGDGSINYSGKWCKVYIQDCYFKNAQHPTSYFGGGAVHGNNNGPADTVVVTNNTMFLSNGYFFLVHNHIHNYVEFNHNTIILNSVNVFYDFYGRNSVIKNNIIYAGNSFGATNQQRLEGWFDKDGEAPGIVSVDTLTSDYTSFGITEAQRKYKVLSNAYYWPKEVKDYWAKDSIPYTTSFMNTRTAGMFNDKTTWPGFVSTDNKEVDPGFGTVVTNQNAKFYTYADLVRTNKQTDILFTYSANGADMFTVNWPLTEKFTYSASLLGTDGLPLGDLNAYPDKRKQWGTLGVSKTTNAVPEAYKLEQNYPNPFNPSTNIHFSIPKESNVSLKVYNAIGQEVATLVNDNMKAGSYVSTFDAKGLSSGVYFYTLKANNFTTTSKMILMK